MIGAESNDPAVAVRLERVRQVFGPVVYRDALEVLGRRYARAAPQCVAPSLDELFRRHLVEVIESPAAVLHTEIKRRATQPARAQSEEPRVMANHRDDALSDETIDRVLRSVGASRVRDERGEWLAAGQISECTPQHASELLKLRPAYQRTIDHAHVARIRDAMLEGRYVENGSTICISVDGHLVDGQQRLTAQVAANMTLRHTVCVVSDRAFATIDSLVKARSTPQLTLLASHGAVKLRACVISGLVWDSTGIAQTGARTLTKTQRAEMALAHPYRDQINDLFSRAKPAFRPRGGHIVGIIRCLRVDEAAALEFFTHAVGNEQNLGDVANTAVQLMSTTLANSSRYFGRKMYVGISVDAAHAIQCFNAYAADRPIYNLRGLKAGAVPAPRARKRASR